MKEKLIKIMAILSIVLTLAALVLSFFVNSKRAPKVVDQALEVNNLKDEAKKASSIDAYKIEKIVVNLATGQNRLRVVDMSLDLITFQPQHIDLLEKNKAIVYDSIIEITSKIQADELNSVSGKILLEDRIKKKIHKEIGTTVIRKILFSQFVIQ